VIARLERAAAHAWPATISRLEPDGWLLRSTPGLDRGRSNHALPPCRVLHEDELGPAIERVAAFAAQHGTRTGIQVGPLALHGALDNELTRRGWSAQWPTVVLVADRLAALEGPGGAGPSVVASDHATAAWLAAWAESEPGRDVGAHRRTVLAGLAGRASFARIGQRAVAIGVQEDGLLGLFCLAVAPGHRRAGLGTAIVRALLERSDAAHAYLQVEADNDPALALYGRLGFTESHRYRHRVAPSP
jgi:ribosomal protein S18 acetylase RimI-like enzyme